MHMNLNHQPCRYASHLPTMRMNAASPAFTLGNSAKPPLFNLCRAASPLM